MMKKLLASTLALSSTSVLAHTGHLSNDSVHGLLHVEHIAALVAVGLIAYLVKVFISK